MGWDLTLPFIGYGKKFQKHRRLIQQPFTRQEIKKYHHIQTKEAHRLALNLLEHPDNREEMIGRSVTSPSFLPVQYNLEFLFRF